MIGQKSNRWREYCNPLRGLTMQRLMALIEEGERGEYADLQWLYHYMERSDPVIYSVLQRRRAALLDCDWDVRIAAPAAARGKLETGNMKLETGDSDSRQGAKGAKFDEVLAEEQAACLREAYDKLENFREAVGFLASGVFRGYAHLEKHRGRAGC